MPNSLVIVFAGSRETSLTGESKSWFQGTGVKFVEQEKLGTYLKINRSIFSFKFRVEKDTQEFLSCLKYPSIYPYF